MYGTYHISQPSMTILRGPKACPEIYNLVIVEPFLKKKKKWYMDIIKERVGLTVAM